MTTQTITAKMITLTAAAILSFSTLTLATFDQAEARYKGGSHKGFKVIPGSGYNGGVRWFYSTDGGRGGMASTAKKARKAGRALAREERRQNRGESGGFKAENGGPCGGYGLC